MLGNPRNNAQLQLQAQSQVHMQSQGQMQSQKVGAPLGLMATVNLSGEVFQRRWGLQAARLNSKCYIFGGYCWNSEGVETYFDDLYELNPILGTSAKIFPMANSPCPAARFGHSLCADDDMRSLILFGGRTEQASLSDVWIFSIDEKKWKNVHSGPGGPQPRCWQAAAYTNGCLYIHGGWTETSDVLVDLWEFDCLEGHWRILYSPAASPTASFLGLEQSTTAMNNNNAGSAAVEDEKTTDVSTSSSPGTTARGSNRISTSTGAIVNRMVTPSSNVSNSKEQIMAAEGRSCHCMELWNNGLYIYGGVKSGNLITMLEKTMLKFDLQTLEWVSVSLADATKPPPRLSAASIVMDNERWIIHGGMPTFPTATTSENSNATSCMPLPMEDVWEYSFPESRWRKIQDIPIPSELNSSASMRRYGHTLIQEGQNLWFLGGADHYARASPLICCQLILLPPAASIQRALREHAEFQVEKRLLTRKLDLLSETVQSLVARMDQMETDRFSVKENAAQESSELESAVQRLQSLSKLVHMQGSRMGQVEAGLQMLRTLGMSLAQIGASLPPPQHMIMAQSQQQQQQQ